MKSVENNENLPEQPVLSALALSAFKMQGAPVPDMSLDHSLLHQIYAGDKDYAREIFETFLSEADANRETLKDAFLQEAWAELARLAHKIKPEYAFVGLPQVEATLSQIECLSKSAGDRNQLISLFTEFDHFYPAAIASVKSYLSTLAL